MTRPMPDEALTKKQKRALLWVLSVNTVLCALAVVPAFMVQMASVMGGAAPGAGQLGAFIAIAGLLLPAVPIVSIVGSWSTIKWRRLSLAFVLLPWLYGAVLCATIALFFLG